MKLPIILTVILWFCINISYALIKVNFSRHCGCESFDFFQEIDKISKIDSTKYSIIANYCLHYQKDGVLELLLYEHIVPLAIKIQKECHRHSISGKIDLESDKIFFGELSLGDINFCISSVDNDVCKININELYNIYDYINDFRINSCFKEMDKVSYLFNKYFPIEWNIEISCDDEKIPILGNNYIYISGICNEEQLKKIEKNKNNKETGKNE